MFYTSYYKKTFHTIPRTIPAKSELFLADNDSFVSPATAANAANEIPQHVSLHEQLPYFHNNRRNHADSLSLSLTTTTPDANNRILNRKVRPPCWCVCKTDNYHYHLVRVLPSSSRVPRHQLVKIRWQRLYTAKSSTSTVECWWMKFIAFFTTSVRYARRYHASEAQLIRSTRVYHIHRMLEDKWNFAFGTLTREKSHAHAWTLSHIHMYVISDL